MTSLSTVSSELFFNETKYQILTPNIQYSQSESPTFNDILSAADQRTFAFYDEQLRIYLYASIPQQVTGTGEEIMEAVRLFYNQLDIHIEASVIDSTTTIPTTQPTKHQRTISKQTSTQSSAPSSPQLNKRDPVRGGSESLPFFSHTYNSKDPEPMIFQHNQAHCCLFPVDIPIAYIKTRGGHPILSTTINIAYRSLPTKLSANEEQSDDAEYDVDLFDTVDLLSGLGEDPTFVTPNGRPSQHFIMENRLRQPNGPDGMIQPQQAASHLLTLRSQIKETIPLRPGLMVKMRTTNVSVMDKTVMMSVELENPVDTGCQFTVSKVEVQVSNAVVAQAFTKEVQVPFHLNTSDQMVLLYNVTLLEDGSTKAPAPSQRIFSSRRPLPPPSSTPNSPALHDERIQPQRVTIHVYGTPIVDGIPAQILRSKWNTILDVSNTRQKQDLPDPRFNSLLSSSPSYLTRSQTSVATSLSVSPGARSVGSLSSQPHSSLEGVFGNMSRPVVNYPLQQQKGYHSPISTPYQQRDTTNNGASARRAPELEVADGIVISFTAPEVVHVGKVFSLHIFIVNRSKHTRRFQVMIPNRKRQVAPDVLMGTKTALPLLPMEQTPIDPFIDENEFLRQYFENETHEADMISLENNVRLCPLGPSTSQTVDIRFIAVKEKLHTIDLVQLVDQDTGFVTNLRHVLEVFVEK
ncbi:TRAPP trafficking subunit Trs65-domain-containing protein [Halteromyces radiatus]|uniref:TRAPP trafficking subunit Trs65-domain-containing protein n=1 Tax=Halteromyces radiatus TaxID=101107 RepID=UPI00221F1333|nr:TRAPP trafficking subunit Trs65-domain-containing protein [Halteromyces radiatus]KAI8077782.1 TRAPP trafficking subunit Trs65-domain-containing protein [Halteromyces radiatus]